MVLTLAPVVFFAVYANFSTGVRLWQRLQIETPEETPVIFIQKARRDFENMMRSSTMPFRGEKAEAVFPTGIESEPALGGRRAIGEVRYFYDENAKAVMRETRNMNELYKEVSGPKNLLIKDVVSFEIAYLVFETLDNSYAWNDTYQPDQPGSLPLAVRLSYHLAGMSEKAEQTFFIPAEGSLL